MKILLHHFFRKLKYDLVYMPTGPMPGTGNRVILV